MPKIIFPEASNEYIQEVVKNLNAKNICEAITEEMPVEQAAEKVKTGEYAAMVAGVDYSHARPRCCYENSRRNSKNCYACVFDLRIWR